MMQVWSVVPNGWLSIPNEDLGRAFSPRGGKWVRVPRASPWAGIVRADGARKNSQNLPHPSLTSIIQKPYDLRVTPHLLKALESNIYL